MTKLNRAETLLLNVSTCSNNLSSYSVLFSKPRVKLILAATAGINGSIAALTNLIALAATYKITSDLFDSFYSFSHAFSSYKYLLTMLDNSIAFLKASLISTFSNATKYSFLNLFINKLINSSSLTFN